MFIFTLIGLAQAEWLVQGNWTPKETPENADDFPPQHIFNQPSFKISLGKQHDHLRIMSQAYYQMTLVNTYNTQSTEHNRIGVLHISQNYLYVQSSQTQHLELFTGLGWALNLPLASRTSTSFSQSEADSYDDQIQSFKASIRSFGCKIPIGIQYNVNETLYYGLQLDNAYYLSVFPTNNERVWTSYFLQQPQIFIGFQL